MKQSVAKAWVKALRSGRYRQHRGKLRSRTGSMCCLGVLCEISKLSSWDKENNYAGSSELLPSKVEAWADMISMHGALPKGSVGVKANVNLADLNDSRYTFKQLADVIEKYWRQL